MFLFLVNKKFVPSALKRILKRRKPQKGISLFLNAHIAESEVDLFKVDRLQIFLVAKKDISTCRNCSSVGCLKCVQFHN